MRQSIVALLQWNDASYDLSKHIGGVKSKPHSIIVEIVLFRDLTQKSDTIFNLILADANPRDIQFKSHSFLSDSKTTLTCDLKPWGAHIYVDWALKRELNTV